VSETEKTAVSSVLQCLIDAWEPGEARKFTALQRVLLVTDGNLTAALEAAFLEAICVQKLGQREVILSEQVYFGRTGGTALSRTVLLTGRESGRVYAHAESLIALDELSPSFREALLLSDIPIGRLWVAHKMELYKEFLELRCSFANDLAEHFSCSRGESVVRRRYRVYTAGRPVMMITEHLPLHLAYPE
jgi:chorismate-pyruvate lyase